MRIVSKSFLRKNPLTLTKASGRFSVLMGAAVILGWYAHWTHVLQILPGLPPMQFNTAIGLVIAGIALTFLASGRRTRIVPWLGAAVMLLGFFSAVEYVTRKDLGIDQLFIQAYLSAPGSVPGRMSPLTSTCFLFFGALLVLTGGGYAHRRLTVIGLASCVVGMIASLTLLGYGIGIQTDYGWGAYMRMALHTALTFLVLSTGLLAWSIDEGRRQNLNFLRWLPVTASATLMVVIALTSSASFSQLNESSFWQKHTYDVLQVTQVLLGDLTDTQRGMRSYVLSGHKETLDIYHRGLNAIPVQLQQLQTLTRDNPIQQARLKTLRMDIDNVTAYARGLLDARDRQGLTGAAAVESTGAGTRRHEPVPRRVAGLQ